MTSDPWTEVRQAPAAGSPPPQRKKLQVCCLLSFDRGLLSAFGDVQVNCWHVLSGTSRFALTKLFCIVVSLCFDLCLDLSLSSSQDQLEREL